MQKLIALSLFFAAAICAMAGCASGGSGGSGGRDNAGASGGSGITVFGTIDANVSGARNR